MAKEWQYRTIKWKDKRRGTMRRQRKLTFDVCPRCGGKKLIKSSMCRECWEAESQYTPHYCIICGSEVHMQRALYCCHECKKEGQRRVANGEMENPSHKAQKIPDYVFEEDDEDTFRNEVKHRPFD